MPKFQFDTMIGLDVIEQFRNICRNLFNMLDLRINGVTYKKH